MIDAAKIRRSLADLKSDHDASGQHRPTVDEIFAPEQHANALDPNTPIVVGARGAGKSFWAGVLEHDDTREVAALAYPNLGLGRLIVSAGYTGFATDSVVTPKIIDARVPEEQEKVYAFGFWQAVILREAKLAASNSSASVTIKTLMSQYADPEDAQEELKLLDETLAKSGRLLLVTFDALDTVSRDWKRSSLLIDALFEVIWSLRARRCLRAKVFIRPEQLNDETLRFVELPKLRSGRVELQWSQVDLYGLLFWRLAGATDSSGSKAFRDFATELGAPIPRMIKDRRKWDLLQDLQLQKKAMEQLAGKYMGRGLKKGGTYDWPYKHLADATGMVTPRSFIKLFNEAARHAIQEPTDVVISPEGIRHGLREASRVRVDQLGVEYQWIKRALAPLAGLTVPCTEDAIYQRWTETNTVNLILKAAADKETGFLPPFPPRSKGKHLELLATAMTRIGVFSYRTDDRVDIPDLFRVAALMLKRGGTTPSRG